MSMTKIRNRQIEDFINISKRTDGTLTFRLIVKIGKLLFRFPSFNETLTENQIDSEAKLRLYTKWDSKSTLDADYSDLPVMQWPPTPKHLTEEDIAVRIKYNGE
jgi:hypothetical protein